MKALDSGLAARWRTALAVYAHTDVLVLGLLGFSAGLPFLLVFSTLSAWLRDSGVALGTIGFFSWLGITYSIKVFWAPVVDGVRLPLLGALGQRRGWMFGAQLLIAAGLVGLSGTDPVASLVPVVMFGLLVAFGSATQDVAVDAYRIEIAGVERQAALSAAYIFGYRLALLASGAGALYLAEVVSWRASYLSMAACMAVGLCTTLAVREPAATAVRGRTALAADGGGLVAWVRTMVAGPFVEFFARNGVALSLLLLGLIAVYRLSDITMGVMANPFYLDLGFSKAEIAGVAKVFGFAMTIAGSALGGVLVVRFGLPAMLLWGAMAVAVTNLAFAGLALLGDASLSLLAVVVSADSFSGGFANVVFIAFLSGLTHRSYTATQYALFSSLMTLLGKFVGGYAGVVVEAVGYPWFFALAAILGVPAMILVLLVGRRAPDVTATDNPPAPVVP